METLNEKISTFEENASYKGGNNYIKLKYPSFNRLFYKGGVKLKVLFLHNDLKRNDNSNFKMTKTTKKRLVDQVILMLSEERNK